MIQTPFSLSNIRRCIETLTYVSPYPTEMMLIIGQARVYGSGTDAVLFTYGAMVHNCLEVQSRMQSNGINIRVVDLRTLQPLDDDCIRTSVQECGKVLIVHEDTKTGGIAGEITAHINEFAFEWLDAPVRRVTAIDAPIPFNKNLERAFFSADRAD